jgi:hypothetical protein
MAYYLRAPREALGHGSYATGEFVFIRSAPLVMHDRCADANGCTAAPRDTSREGHRAHFDARDAFAAQAGKGFDLCWDFAYSDRPDAPPCYWCGEPVIGRG